MAVDSKLVQWINPRGNKVKQGEVIEQLKERRHNEQDIVDSYKEVVKKGAPQSEGNLVVKKGE